MNHNDIRHKLSEYIDRAVTDAERAEIEAHIKTCATCAEALTELRKTVQYIKDVEAVVPPDWMTKKIMAEVRAESEKRSGILNILVGHFVIGRAIRVAAVLFITVIAYYIYSSMHPAERYAEAPVDRLAKQEAPAEAPEARKEKAPEIAERRDKKVEQAPGYRSLDMKDEYERPAPPVPAEPAEGPVLAGKAGSAAPRALMAKPAAPPMAAQQAAGAAPSPERKQAAATEGLILKQELGEASEDDREAEERLTVTEYFVNHDLQETMKVRGLQFITRKVPTDLAGLEWLREMAAYRSIPCGKRYIVDVELSGSSTKYLYCFDKARIRLLGVFTQISGVWMERK